MSQSVQLDMEVLQRIKFLMEYDVMKTSSENFLVEQSTDLQKLAKEKGFGPVSLSKAQELYNQGKLGNTFDPISGQAKVLASRDPIVQKANKEKSGTIDVARTDVSKMYSQPSQQVREMRLDELTLKVREIMSDWRTGTVETIAAMLGIGVPVIIGANGLWFTLELAQVLKGTPDWLSVAFSFIAVATAGSQSAVLKPWYTATAQLLKGKGKSFMNVLNAMSEAAINSGLWRKLKPILDGVSKFSDTILSLSGKTWKWLNDNVFWIFKGVTWLGKVTVNGLTNLVSSLFNIFDTWLAGVGKKAGLSPEFSGKLGPAARVSTAVGGIGYGTSKYINQPPPTMSSDVLKKQDTGDWEY